MSKSKHSAEWKIMMVEKYLKGEGSYEQLAKAHGIGKKTLEEWVHRYIEQGAAGFKKGAGNAQYSKDFKTMCVEAVLRGEGSVDGVVAKYNISTNSILRKWIKKYNANIELKSYEPKREVYMAARRKTTSEERKEIVEYCIANNNDYKGTAARYDVSYNQVYSWVRKYQETGEDGLEDKRGRHKSEEEVDELERLRRENLPYPRLPSDDSVDQSFQRNKLQQKQNLQNHERAKHPRGYPGDVIKKLMPGNMPYNR